MHTIHKKYTVLLTMPIKFRISWFWTLCITSLCVETTQLHSYVAHLVRVCTALQRTQVPFPGHMSGSSHWPVSPDPGDLMASTGTAFMCTPYMGLIIEWDLLCSDNKLQIPVLRYSKIIPYAHCGSRPRYHSLSCCTILVTDRLMMIRFQGEGPRKISDLKLNTSAQ